MHQKDIYEAVRTLPLGVQNILKDVTLIQSYIDARLKPIIKYLQISLPEKFPNEIAKEKLREFIFLLTHLYLDKPSEDFLKSSVECLMEEFNLPSSIKIDQQNEVMSDILYTLISGHNETMLSFAERFYDWKKIDANEHTEVKSHLKKILTSFLQSEYSNWTQHLAQLLIPGLVKDINMEKYDLSQQNKLLHEQNKLLRDQLTLSSNKQYQPNDNRLQSNQNQLLGDKNESIPIINVFKTNNTPTFSKEMQKVKDLASSGKKTITRSNSLPSI